MEPGAPAVEFKGAWWTWADLDGIGRAVDAALDLAGLGGGSRVGCVMRNCPELGATLLRIIASERCVVSLNPSMPDANLIEDLNKVRPPVIIALERDWARPALLDTCRELGVLGLVLTGDRAAPVRCVEGLETVRGTDLRLQAEAGVGVEMLTSGTTGAPKRIPLKALTLERAVIDAGLYDGRKPGDAPRLRSGVTIFNSPFAHISGIFSLFNGVASGRKLALLERFNVPEWVDVVRRHRARVAGAPPSALRMILDAGVAKEDLSSLVAFRAGTAPLDPDLADEFQERYGIPVLQNYSATEFAGAGAGWTLEDHRLHHKTKRGSVGRINPGIKARVVDPETGAVLAPGEQGLLEIFAVHIGDGRSWLRTTDLAVLDADDFLWIKGRADNAIIRGGFKVIPDDVVRVIEQHPAVREAAVVGLPDPRLGQVPAAAYLVKSGMAAPDEAELKAFLKERLLAYQVPVALKAVQELPRTPSLKVSQPELRKLFISEIEPD